MIVCLLTIVLSACDNQKIEEIDWQLPMNAPVDPHAASLGNDLPDWATKKEGHAKVIFLKKSTARTFSVDVTNHASQSINGWTVEMLGIADGLRIKDREYINDDAVINPAAFIALYEGNKLMYKGWMYQNFPELFGMDNLDWKIWIEDVNMPHLSDGASK